MHFSPGKIQQRVRSAQRFSHLKCIEFITYSRPTAAPTYPSTRRFTLIDNVFSRARDSRVFFVTARVSSTRSGIRAKNAAENKIAMEKFWDALTAGVRFVPVRFAPHEFSLAVHRLSIFAREFLKITAVERIPPHGGHGDSNFARRVTQ